MYTSRKHGKIESHSFSHCSSFDHHDMQSLNDYFFLVYQWKFQEFGGFWYTARKVLKNNFMMVYYMPHNSQNCSLKFFFKNKYAIVQ